MLDEILTAPASIAAHRLRQRQKPHPWPFSECHDACGQQQQDPDAEKEPREIYQVGINEINVHDHTSNPCSANASVLKFRFPGQLLIFVHNLANRIEAAERGQMHIGERIFNF